MKETKSFQSTVAALSYATICVIVSFLTTAYLKLPDIYGRTTTNALSAPWMPVASMTNANGASELFRGNIAVVEVSKDDFRRLFANQAVYFSQLKPGEVTYCARTGKVICKFTERISDRIAAPPGTEIVGVTMSPKGALVATLAPVSARKIAQDCAMRGFLGIVATAVVLFVLVIVLPALVSSWFEFKKHEQQKRQQAAAVAERCGAPQS